MPNVLLEIWELLEEPVFAHLNEHAVEAANDEGVPAAAVQLLFEHALDASRFDRSW